MTVFMRNTNDGTLSCFLGLPNRISAPSSRVGMKANGLAATPESVERFGLDVKNKLLKSTNLSAKDRKRFGPFQAGDVQARLATAECSMGRPVG